MMRNIDMRIIHTTKWYIKKIKEFTIIYRELLNWPHHLLKRPHRHVTHSHNLSKIYFHCIYEEEQGINYVRVSKLWPTWMTNQSLADTLHIDRGRFKQCVVDLTIPKIYHIKPKRANRLVHSPVQLKHIIILE